MIYLFFYLCLLIFFSFLLIKSTEILITALNHLSKSSRLSKFGLTSFIIALATSLPEFFVGITAALEKKPNLALGNILGANIANISLVVGGAALIGGSLGIVGDFFLKDIFYVFLAGCLPLVMLIDSRLSRVEGLFLLTVYGIYNVTVLKGKSEGIKGISMRKVLRRLNHTQTDKQIGWIFFGTALLIFSADGIVKIASFFAQKFKVPLVMIGLFLVAIGTTLPELSFNITAVRKKQVAMVFGNLLGSIVANSTLILGVTALISPIVLDGGFKVYLWASLAFVIIFFTFWFFVRSKKKLERWEGVLLILFYLAFIFFEFWLIKARPSEAFYAAPLK